MNIDRMRSLASDYARFVRNADDRAVTPLKELYEHGKASPCLIHLLILDESKKSVQHLANQIEMDALQTGPEAALKKYFTGIKNLKYFGVEMDKQECIQSCKQEYLKSLNEKYPLTKNLRLRLMYKYQVVMGKVSPKMGFLEKMLKWYGSVPKEFSKMLKKGVK